MNEIEQQQEEERQPECEVCGQPDGHDQQERCDAIIRAEMRADRAGY